MIAEKKSWTWRGKPIRELSREELIQAFELMCEEKIERDEALMTERQFYLQRFRRY